MRTKMVLPTLGASSLGADVDDSKYSKGLNLKRSLSNAAMWSRNHRNGLSKWTAVVAGVTLLVLAINQRRHVAVSVDIEYKTTLADELNDLDLGKLGLGADELREVRAHEAGDEPTEDDADVVSDEVASNAQSDEFDETIVAGTAGSAAQDEEAVEAESEEDDGNIDNEAAGGFEAEDGLSDPAQADKPLSQMSNDELFENAKELEACGRIRMPVYKRRPTDWWALKRYLTIYTERAPYACVPKLRRHLQLTLDDFTELFRKYAQPVLFRFENLRSIGSKLRSFTLDELQELFPFDPTKDRQITYTANKKFDSEFLDLGPAIYNFKDDAALVKTKGGQRNYPRNMKVKPAALARLGVEAPRLVPGLETGEGVIQSPSLWFGSSSSPTPMHSDCCDNFVLMLSGTKEFALAPPTDWHALTPRCIGKRKSLCYANIADPTEPGVRTDHFNKMMVDVEPGMVLYMPAGWFHAVKNRGATLMTNLWTRGKQTAGVFSCHKK